MLRKFKIKVDGKEYLVEMEEIGGVPVSAPAPVVTSEPTVAPTPVPAPESVSAPTVSVPAGENAMPAPMPGTILKVLVNVGDVVNENQPLMILEAMKMENEIVATTSGTVASIHVSQGQVVNPGDALITIA